MQDTKKQLVFNTVGDFRKNLKQALDFASLDPENEVVIKRTFQTFVVFEDNRG